MEKIATFNVNGIRARLAPLLAWLDGEPGIQILALQEIKAREEDFPFPFFEERGFTVSCQGEKSFNGVAIISRIPPDDLVRGLPGREHLGARFIAARFANLWILNSYVPQGRSAADPMFTEKLRFIEAIGDYIQSRHQPGDALIWLGDINVAPHDIDVYDPVKLKGQVGFHPEEQAALGEVMDKCRLYDLFRTKNPRARQFSFWDYRAPNGFKRDLGWRIDHFLVSKPVLEHCTACWIAKDLRGEDKPSDHVPVLASFSGSF
ncbi:MAG: exodeoxyribonuclease III [Desulfarculales bacterium]|nr:exodeoxyribonuclease III [Desulfarculales bacterium]